MTTTPEQRARRRDYMHQRQIEHERERIKQLEKRLYDPFRDAEPQHDAALKQRIATLRSRLERHERGDWRRSAKVEG